MQGLTTSYVQIYVIERYLLIFEKQPKEYL